MERGYIFVYFVMFSLVLWESMGEGIDQAHLLPVRPQMPDRFNLAVENIPLLPFCPGSCDIIHTFPRLPPGYGNCVIPEENLNVSASKDPEVDMSPCEMATSKGYPCEKHMVITKDGYILEVHRIPHGKKQSDQKKREIVLLVHGLLSGSHDWLVNLEDQSLGYVLADNGYDVWLGNLRGNTYSSRHLFLSPEDEKFWEFSWDEMAKFDVPAMINYTLIWTNSSQLYYIGHSQGTMVAFSAFSEDIELGKKVKTFFALGPVTTVGHMTSPARTLADTNAYVVIEKLAGAFGKDDLFSRNLILSGLSNFCANDKTVILCQSVIFLIAGYDCNRMNASRLPVYLSKTPAGTSLQNLVHFAQGIKSCKFAKHDFGIIDNIKRYSQFCPPEYDLSRMETPVALFHGKDDILADPEDVSLLLSKLKSVIYDSEIENFDHMDFMWAMDAVDLVYADIIRIMQEQ